MILNGLEKMLTERFEGQVVNAETIDQIKMSIFNTVAGLKYEEYEKLDYTISSTPDSVTITPHNLKTALLFCGHIEEFKACSFEQSEYKTDTKEYKLVDKTLHVKTIRNENEK